MVKSACFYRYRSRFGKLSKRKGFRTALSRIIVFEMFVSRNSAALVRFSQFGFKYQKICSMSVLAVWYQMISLSESLQTNMSVSTESVINALKKIDLSFT